MLKPYAILRNIYRWRRVVLPVYSADLSHGLVERPQPRPDRTSTALHFAPPAVPLSQLKDTHTHQHFRLNVRLLVLLSVSSYDMSIRIAAV